MDDIFSVIVLLLLAVLAGWVLGVIGFFSARRALREVAALRRQVAALVAGGPAAAAAQPQVPQPHVSPPLVPQPLVPQPLVPQPLVPQPHASQPTVPQPIAPQPHAPAPLVPEAPAAREAPQPAAMAFAMPPPASTLQPAAPGSDASSGVPPPPGSPPPGSPPPESPPPGPAAPPAATPPERRLDIEALLTMRWGVWLGAAALLMSGVFLIRYAVDQGMLGPGVRCVLAALLGCLLVGLAEWLRRQEMLRPGIPEHTAPGLAAGGVAVWFAAAYGAGVLYTLIPPLAGFALMAAAALAGMALSLRHGPVVAAIGIVGAFIAPALIATANPSLPALFLYLWFVTAAALAVVRYCAWIWLGWATTIADALWVLVAILGGIEPETWAPAMFVPAAVALNLALLPPAALAHAIGRKLAWIPCAVLGTTGVLLWLDVGDWPTCAGVLLLAPLLVWKAAREPRLVLLPCLAALAFLVMLGTWPLAIAPPALELPPDRWTPAAVSSLLWTATLGAGFFAACGCWFERRRSRPLPWSSLVAAVPVLALATCFAVVEAFHPRPVWAAVALALATALTVNAADTLRRSGRAGEAAGGGQAKAGGEAPPEIGPEELAGGSEPPPTGPDQLVEGRAAAGHAPTEPISSPDPLVSGMASPQAGPAEPIDGQGPPPGGPAEPVAARQPPPGGSRQPADGRDRAGAHAAGAVAALALGLAMLLSEQWLTLAVSLLLPALAWIEAKADLPALRRVALAVAAVVLTRLLANWYMLDYMFPGPPVLNALLPTYGVPALAFAAAATMFRRRGDDLTVGVLEAGSVAFVTVLAALEIRDLATGGDIRQPAGSFAEAASHIASLAVLASVTMRIATRLDRPVLMWGWRVQGGLALFGAGVLLLCNPLAIDLAIGHLPMFDWLLVAYLLPAGLAVLALRHPATAAVSGLRTALAVYACLAVFAWITMEIRHLFHPAGMYQAPVEPAELWAWSGAWLVYGGVLMAAGIRGGARPWRLAALAVIGVTAAKVFLVDMSGLVGLWRVLSFLGLGLALIGLGAIYRRFMVVPKDPGQPAA